MPEVMYKDGMKVPVKMWTEGVPVEAGAKKQLEYMAGLPFMYKHIAVMPDVHAGIGAVVGSVVATDKVVIPAAVGVDIFCGISAYKLSITKDELHKDLPALRRAIEKAVPHGRTDNGGKYDKGSWNDIPQRVQIAWSGLEGGYNYLDEFIPDAIAHPRYLNQLGTLGTGNHFISLSEDIDSNIWVMVHSGSRGIGAKIAQYFIDRAKTNMKNYYVELPDANLAFIPQAADDFGYYLAAIKWLGKYAEASRELMLDFTVEAIGSFTKVEVVDSICCHHNYASMENHFGKNVIVTRKGAISAKKGQLGIIPGAMGFKSYIVEGLGNKESFFSASHGAGRKMSRTQAKKEFTLADHKKATEGVECRKDSEVIDETPGAYKNLDDVMTAQKELVTVVNELKEFLCVKG